MPAAQQVNVEMVDSLAAVRAGVDDQAVAVGEVLGAGDFHGCGEEMAEHGGVLRRGMGVGGEVLLGDEQDMDRRLRIDVREGEDVVILIEALGGDGTGCDFAEEAIHKDKIREARYEM